MSYQFKGYDWTELAECWGIEVDYEKSFISEEFPANKVSEIVNVKVNGTYMSIETKDDDEIIREKLKKFLFDNIDMSNGEFTSDKIRIDIHNFLKALIKESKREFGDYNHPIYEGMLKIESDYTLAQWIICSIRGGKLWT